MSKSRATILSLFAQVHSAKLNAEMKPITGSDGFFLTDPLLFYTTMAPDAGRKKVSFTFTLDRFAAVARKK